MPQHGDAHVAVAELSSRFSHLLLQSGVGPTGSQNSVAVCIVAGGILGEPDSPGIG